jgi:hypothetical protein
MPFAVTIHYRNTRTFADPRLYVEYGGSGDPEIFAATAADAFGPVFDVETARREFRFKFKDGPGLGGSWEPHGLDRSFRPVRSSSGPLLTEVWCTGEKAFTYPVEPRTPEPADAAAHLRSLVFKPGHYIPGTGGFSGLGAHALAGGGVLFGFYHPNAARVYVAGGFNEWQRPSHDTPDPSRFVELRLYRGYFGYPNVWLGVATAASPGDEYSSSSSAACPPTITIAFSNTSPTHTRARSGRTSATTTASSSTPRSLPGAMLRGARPTSPISCSTS